MVFSINTIKDAKNKSFPVKEQKTVNTNMSIFFESLRLIEENNRNTYKLFESFTKTDSNQVIQEKILSFSDLTKVALSRIDPKKIIKRIFEGFLKILENLWNHFHAALLNLFGEDRVIKVYKKKLQSINITINFKEERYIYSNLGQSTSYTSFKSELEKELSSLILNLSKIGSTTSNQSDYIRNINELKQSMILSENDISDLRGKILGSRNPIEKENFAAELYKYFRNNGYKISPGEINSDEIRRVFDEYSENKNNLKEVSKDKNDLIKVSKDIQNQVMNLRLDAYIQETIPQEASVLFISLLENQCKKIKIICDLYIQVFGAKLDAIKESYIQYRSILFESCQELTRRGL